MGRWNVKNVNDAVGWATTQLLRGLDIERDYEYQEESFPQDRKSQELFDTFDIDSDFVGKAKPYVNTGILIGPFRKENGELFSLVLMPYVIEDD